jgi:hypothetical protein
MSLDGEPFCVTLEPYQGKIIPAGQYLAAPYSSPKFGPVYLLRDVSGRSMIELHPLNLGTETAGCIGLAEKYGKLYGNLAILNSGATFKEFMRRMDGDTLHLTIQEAF